MSARPLLEVTDLQVSYGPAGALFGVNLSVGPGETVAVLGPNLVNTIIAVTVVYLPRYVRLVRASALGAVVPGL